MLNNLRKQTKGFTIIEVLIVLAIAGLIFLIVFLAVPALQRNSRNTGRRNDVSRVGGAATEFVSNNNGRLPQNNVADRTAIVNAAGTLGQYDFNPSVAGSFANFTLVTGGTPAAITNVNQMRLVTGVTCSTNGTVAGGNTRQMAIQYAVESSGSNVTSVCQEI